MENANGESREQKPERSRREAVQQSEKVDLFLPPSPAGDLDTHYRVFRAN
jgi:hypothetical protein